MQIQDKALLVQLSISQWTGRKFDRKTTQEVAAAHGVTSEVGRYNKVLLPTGAKLKELHSATNAIRQFFYHNTLPWGLEGTQMLPTGNYLQFTTEFRHMKANWQQLVADFLNEYDNLRNQAQLILGTMYNAADYPPRDELEKKFSIDLAVFPVPSDDFRVQVTDQDLQDIQKDVLRRVADAQQRAVQETWKRLYDKVKHMSDKLSDPAAIFRNTMVENLQEVCELVPRLNFTDDPELEKLRQEVADELAAKNPESLRNDPDLRRETADKARAIMDKMGVYMGGST